MTLVGRLADADMPAAQLDRQRDKLLLMLDRGAGQVEVDPVLADLAQLPSEQGCP